MSTATEMDELIDRHIAAEVAGDSDAAIAVYSNDVVHDVVGWPTGPVTGPTAARCFYEALMAAFANERMDKVWSRHGEDFCVVEHEAEGRFEGEFMGIPGQGKRATFRMLHVFDFADGQITRENIWLDGGAIVAQLTA